MSNLISDKDAAKLKKADELKKVAPHSTVDAALPPNQHWHSTILRVFRRS
jgi:hypothetical protein